MATETARSDRQRTALSLGFVAWVVVVMLFSAIYLSYYLPPITDSTSQVMGVVLVLMVYVGYIGFAYFSNRIARGIQEGQL